MQLKPYFEHFPANIFTLSFEELVADTRTNLKLIYNWLGVDDSFMPEILPQKRHVTPKRLVQIQGRGKLSKFTHSSFCGVISKFVPRDLRGLARKLAERDVYIDAINKQQLVEYLRPIHIPQTEELVRLLGREFREWKTLYGAMDTQ